MSRHLGIAIDTGASLLPIIVQATVKRSGRAVRMMMDDGRAATDRKPDVRLIGTIAKAHRWWNSLLAEPGLNVTDLAKSEGVTSAYVTRIIRLVFLDPAIVAKIVDGKAPPHIDAKRLTQADAIPISWMEQRLQLGILASR